MAEEGEQQETEGAEAPEGGEEPKKGGKKKLILFGGIGVAVLAIGGGAAFFLMGGDSKEMAAKSGEEASTEEPAAEEEAASEDKKEEAGEGEESTAEGDEEESGEKKEAKAIIADEAEIDFGCTHKFQPFHLNLGNPLENRYISLEIAIEFKCNDDTKAEVTRREPQLRDAIGSVTRRKSREFLLGPDGTDRLRLEMLNRINQYMVKEIDNVFIMDMLIE